MFIRRLRDCKEIIAGDACHLRELLSAKQDYNGDGINDFFFPVYKNIKNISLKIYNRWGIQLFEGSDKLAIWDGKSAGKHCPEGVYFYLVDYEQQGANKGNRQLHGSVSVFY